MDDDELETTQRCGCPRAQLTEKLRDTAGEICSWNAHQRVRKCPTMPTPEAIKKSTIKGKNTQPWKKHNQEMMIPQIPSCSMPSGQKETATRALLKCLGTVRFEKSVLFEKTLNTIPQCGRCQSPEIRPKSQRDIQKIPFYSRQHYPRVRRPPDVSTLRFTASKGPGRHWHRQEPRLWTCHHLDRHASSRVLLWFIFALKVTLLK